MSLECTPASLDNPEQIHTASILWQAVAWLCAVLCFGIAAVAVSQLLNPPNNIKPQAPAILALTALFGSGGLALAYVGLRLRGMKYLVFADRLVQVQGSRVRNFPWKEIREVYHSVHPAWQRYRLVACKGRDVTLTGDVKGHARLGDLISERVAAFHLPDALRQLEGGATVSFGPIQINRGGLVCHGELVPWHHIMCMTFAFNSKEVKGTRLVSTMIHLRVTPSCLVELGEIPNFRLFEKLVRKVHPARWEAARMALPLPPSINWF